MVMSLLWRSIIRSNQLVILPKNTVLKNETMGAYLDSKNKNENSGSIISFLFKFLLVFPRFISNPIFYLLSFFNKLMRKAYMLNLYFFRKKK